MTSPSSSRRFPPPWTVEQTPGGFKVLDANGQALVPGENGLARFAEDVPFKSPSAASAVILGRPDNGRFSWKVQGTKKSYGEWHDDQIDAMGAESILT